MRISSALLIASLTALTACQIYEPTPAPDYTIRVMRTPEGMVAIPPRCPSWSTDVTDPYDNQPLPQFGCADAHNLALLAEKPEDLVHGRTMDDARGVTMVGAMRRYDNNQTRGLIYLSPSPDNSVDVTTSPVAASPLSGDVTGGASSSSSSSSSTGASSGTTTTGSATPSGP